MFQIFFFFFFRFVRNVSIKSYMWYIIIDKISVCSGGRRVRDRMVVGFTTTWTINAYHHENCEFEPCSWQGELDIPVCDKVCYIVTCGRSVVFSGYSDFLHQ